MKGHDCEQCAAYLAAVGGCPEERTLMLNNCSRCVCVNAHGARPSFVLHVLCLRFVECALDFEGGT